MIVAGDTDLQGLHDNTPLSFKTVSYANLLAVWVNSYILPFFIDGLTRTGSV